MPNRHDQPAAHTAPHWYWPALAVVWGCCRDVVAWRIRYAWWSVKAHLEGRRLKDVTLDD